jgi:hypothetical protein
VCLFGETALDDSLAQLISLGYDYSYEYSDGQNMGDPPTKVRIWDTNCSSTPIRRTILIRVGVEFTITCQQ